MRCENNHIISGKYCPICNSGKTEKKVPKQIRKVSLRRVEQNADYSFVRRIFLEIHPVCEVHNCLCKSEDVHHKKGRLGELLTNITHFLAVCRTCHKYIEEHPDWAKERGYSELRTN